MWFVPEGSKLFTIIKEFPPPLSPRRRVLGNIEVQMSGCGAGPGGPPTSWCPPFSGANAAEAQHHNPTRPRLLRIFPHFFLSFFLSFHSSSLASLFFSSSFLLVSSFFSFLLCLHSSLFLPSSSFLLCLRSSLFLPSFSFLLLLFPPLSPSPPFFPSSYLTSFALHRFTSTCNIIICHPLSAVTLFSVGAARVPAPEKNQTLPAIHETQALPSFIKALCTPW